MKLKRIFVTLSMCVVLMMSLTACHSSKSYTFRVDNGEKVQITLDTTDGYNIKQEDGVFTIQKEEEDILNGCFLSAEGYKQKAAAVAALGDEAIIKATPKDAPTFYCYQFEGEAGLETDFLFQIEGGETGVLIGSLASRDEAEAAFKLLKFEKVD